jgi:hypothetical protein
VRSRTVLHVWRPSMVQIIASANSAFDILSLLRVFLVDVVAITQASCAQPMDYYASMMVVSLQHEHQFTTICLRAMPTALSHTGSIPKPPGQVRCERVLVWYLAVRWRNL